MRILLDTHVLIWGLSADARLPVAAADEIQDPSNSIFFSPASIWEIAIKSRLGRADFSFRPDEIAKVALRSGFEELPIISAAAALVADLPLLHRDPFDRLLIVQAMFETLYLYTSDKTLLKYSELVKLVR